MVFGRDLSEDQRKELMSYLRQQWTELQHRIVNESIENLKLLFGIYPCKSDRFQMSSTSIVLSGADVNGQDNVTNDIVIPFTEMQELLCCTEQVQPAIMIKITNKLCADIQHILGLVVKPGSPKLFDVSSPGKILFENNL